VLQSVHVIYGNTSRRVLYPETTKNFVNMQGRIKGFVGQRHVSSLDPVGDSKSIVGNGVQSRLSGLMEGMHG
jgi:hypothetical protein